jgi:hypothetical protein
VHADVKLRVKLARGTVKERLEMHGTVKERLEMHFSAIPS